MILITGASSGIGKFLFEEFTNSGEEVYGTYLTKKNEFENNDKYFCLDVTDYKKAGEIVKNLTPKINNFVLINCAGNNYNCFAHTTIQEKWEKVVSTNLIGTYYMIRAVLPLMREKGYGRIINFSSVVAEVGIPGTSAYAASKSGLWGMTRSIAVENASKGITVNNLNLGYFDIGMINEFSEESQQSIKKKIPTGKFGDPKDIFNAVKFVIASDYINGTSIDINGAIF
ncbi:MAG: SDR family oxidoreductase [Bacteroidota bacterium]|nr:SDR family oxidoreductase [Bacteroidota bacterium]